MAVHSDTNWEIRTTGSDTNGGGFSSVITNAGTDYSQQASAQLSLSDAACTGNTTLTSSTGGFTAAMIGNVVYLSGDGDWYQITAHTDTNTVTIDRNGPNASGMTANVGGCLATPGTISDLPLRNDNRVWVKSGTYTITTSTAGPSGPCDVPAAQVVVEGYGSTRGDLGAKPVINAGAIDSVTLWEYDNSNYSGFFRNLKADANGQTNVVCFDMRSTTLRPSLFCEAVDGKFGFDGGGWSRCRSVGATTGFSGTRPTFCIAEDCGTGFAGHGATFCIAISCTSFGFNVRDYSNGVQLGCVAYDCATGFHQDNTNSRVFTLEGCVAHSCTKGFDSSSPSELSAFLNCGHYNCTTSETGYPEFLQDMVAFIDDPFTDAAGGDFTLSSTGVTEGNFQPWNGETWTIPRGLVAGLGAGGGGSTVVVIEE